ncbi:YafY family protein [Pedobacter gandavensis]|uniref:helix-turn-helix transcriptional regulator n=1 Tax=Pedobacter gandavensis TaxID=2679963 RepID=UPI0024785DC6|nr:YafY family protein [Pedobacter gandavensis]WGQ12158.1 YafY family protein [Pedobacter gandavensis]
MNDNDTKRLSRLTAILTQLQTKRLITANQLAEKFSVSTRTIYRDIKALEQAGVPILTEEGKGYTLMEGYRIPPVMFTESEANALITAEKLIHKNKDASFVKDYSEAINKIKSVLRTNTKDKANLLSDRVVFRQNIVGERTSNFLSTLQLALTNFNLVKIKYHSPDTNQTTERTIEPFAIYSTQDNWILIAFCLLRNDFRAFRLDRIQHLTTLNEQFESHKMTLQEYFEICKKKYSS